MKPVPTSTKIKGSKSSTRDRNGGTELAFESLGGNLIDSLGVLECAEGTSQSKPLTCCSGILVHIYKTHLPTPSMSAGNSFQTPFK